MTSKGNKKESLQVRSAKHVPSHEEISVRAYEIHIERGNIPGNELEHWLEAERQLQKVDRRELLDWAESGEKERHSPDEKN